MRDVKQKCRQYERPWREFCVDKNLEDDWLERLNNLKVFDLINICEGHPERATHTATRYAHIYLKLKDSHIRGLGKDWETIRPTLLKDVHRLFQDGKILLNLDLNFKIRSDQGRFVYQEGLRLKLRANEASKTVSLDDFVRSWFETCIHCMEILDKILLDQLSVIHLKETDPIE